MWLAAVEPEMLIAMSSLLVAATPFLLPVATRRVKELEARIAQLEKHLENCEEERDELRDEVSLSRRRSRR